MPANTTSLTIENLVLPSGATAYTRPFTFQRSLDSGNTLEMSLDLDSIPLVVSGANAVEFATEGVEDSDGSANLDASVVGKITSSAKAVSLTAAGRDGADGAGAPTNKNGDPGEPGGGGGWVSLTIAPEGGASKLTGKSTSNSTILLESTGGSGGSGHAGSTKGLDDDQTSGGSGARGAAGGTLTLVTNGSTQVVSADLAVALSSRGGAGGNGGDASKEDAAAGVGDGGDAGAGGNGGSLFLDRNADNQDFFGSWDITVVGGNGGSAMNLVTKGGSGGSSGRAERGSTGPGGAGGAAGEITLGEAQRSITLENENSIALNIIGEGGPGGDGGHVVGSQTGKPGAGGAGGAGSTVSISGSWDIEGTAKDTRGMVVTSKGGDAGSAGESFFTARSGGVGGAGGALSITISEDSSIMTRDIGIAFTTEGGAGGTGSPVSDEDGGDGQVGGAGGAILFDQQPDGSRSVGSWDIATSQSGAHGIALVSSGGAGGNGGSQADAESGGTVHRGGAGATGGEGGEVTIAPGFRAISTRGNGADAVSVATTGGGGGSGGISGGAGAQGGAGGGIVLDSGSPSEAFGWDLSLSGPNSTALNLVSRGGDGGESGQNTSESEDADNGGVGGAGGKIRLGSSATRDITLSGTASAGLIAQSIGGSGAEGGNADYEGLPGNGGDGGAGGEIEIGGSWNLAATGSGSSGLTLQSAGGAGAVGGKERSPFLTSFTGGGVGGGGGSAGDVVLKTNAASQISTNGAPAIEIISSGGIGGGGGEGTSLGGAAARGGRGGPIYFDTNQSGEGSTGSWDIETVGSNAAGITILSNGGSGGIGGKGETNAGGEGGDGGAAGAISLGAGSRTITTSGDSSPGLVVTAQGGNGGRAGSSDEVFAADRPGGNGGRGGTISLAGSWSIQTEGDSSTGISLSAPGGNGNKAGSLDGSTAGNGGFGAAGGNIWVQGAKVSIATAGSKSVAFQAESVGGVGGLGQPSGLGGAGGSIGISSLFSVSTQTASADGIAAISRGGEGRSPSGKAGRGGQVKVTLLAGGAGVQTQGNGADGLVARSLGGEVESNDSLAAGAGGPVEVTLLQSSGGIATSGANAHGIVATSLANAGSASSIFVAPSGNVTVNVADDVTVSGAGSFGISAKSTPVGGSNPGIVSIAVKEGASVTGGLKSTSGGRAGAAIIVEDGAANSISNAGTITFTPGSSATQSGIAVVYEGSGSLTITNKDGGTIHGSVINARVNPNTQKSAANSGEIVLINRSGGTFEAGPRLDTNSLVNQGRFSPGGEGNRQITRIGGDFEQRTNGLLAIDVDAQGRTDRIVVDGAAALGGLVEIQSLDLTEPIIGARQEVIVRADDGVVLDESTEVTQSVVAQYRLLQTSFETVALSYDIDFANDHLKAALNDNHDSVAEYLQSLYRQSALDGNLAEDLFALDNSRDYADIVNELGAEIAVDNQIITVLAARQFGDALLSCSAPVDDAGSTRFYDKGQCAFLRTEGRGFDRDATNDNLGFSGSSFALTLGGQLALGEDWNLGGALSYERRSTSVDSTTASSDGNQFFAGLSAKRRFDEVELAAAFSLGYGGFDNSRQPLQGTTHIGQQSIWTTSGELRASYLYSLDETFVIPRLSVGYDHVFASSYREDGSSALALDVDGNAETYWFVQPALEFGGAFEAAPGIQTRPHITLGVTQYLGSPEASLSASFASAPAGTPGFVNATRIDRTRFDVEAGLDLFAANYAVIRADGFASLSKNTDIYGGGLKIEFPF